MSTGPNRVDALVVAVKGTVGAIPVVGPIIAEVIGAIVPNQRIDRISRLVDILGRRIADLDPEVVRQRIETPEGIDLLEDGFHQAARALTAERIEYIVNVLNKGITESAVKYAENKMLLRLLDQLTDPEIVLLFWLHSEKRNAQLVEMHRDILVAPQPRGSMSAGDVEKRILFEAREAHLRSLGLLFPHGKGVLYNPHYDQPQGVSGNTEVTPLGRLLLRTIAPK